MGNYAETIGDTVFAQDLYQTVVLYNSCLFIFVIAVMGAYNNLESSLNLSYNQSKFRPKEGFALDNDKIYLDTYVLQQDMRIRLPKSILTNLNAEKGITKFDVFYDTTNQDLILRLSKDSKKELDK